MNNHTVKAYDEDLKTLRALIRHMGELTLQQIRKATRSILERNGTLAHEVIDHDYEINLLETKVDELAVRVLALRQPLASDLRMVVATLKISNQVERIADYAVNIAKRTIILDEMPPFPEVEGLSTLVKIPKNMIERALTAFETYDINLALEVWQMDQEVDEFYNAYLRKIFAEMIADPKNVGPCTQLLFAAKNIERIGDQAQNIAEAVYTMVTGKSFNESDILKNA
ncbi:MAG: phosphate transport system regulatory protein PhoU [Alphaproteobacteria bacterium 41-28]|nr:MAG: phosphate transport system regulatory protein PhoU [Alphaproteobacteria bacterium 41-28]